ncbi:MAG: D-alanyl-D-alanine carboxypeptidase/D-alanyl-D-alanine-endopeptidase [Muribaculaceae bacterium]|nr:D-alanyl-D-alanine carboxypeptidase/D-alanyl-D-alanine-endopeptidase [Muribaculaceae bacterium]
MNILRIISGLGLMMSAAVAFGSCPLSFKGDNVASVGVYIAPVDAAKEPTYNFQSDHLMTPASVMKSVTVAAALKEKGGDYKWETRVMAVGKVQDGTLHGNIIIEGSGDPTLGSKYFSEDQPDFLNMVKQALQRYGIERVDGRTIATTAWPDEGAVPSWELEDIPGVDGAGFYRLNWCDNVFTLMVPSMVSTPSIPNLSVKWNKTSSGLSAWRNAGSSEVTVSGQLGKKQSRAALRISMPDPTSALTAKIDSISHCKGEKISAANDTIVLLTYTSPALRDVTRSLMIRSDNQMAESTLRLLAPGRSRSAAIAAERKALEGVSLQYMRIADGSGLSRHNAVSPRQLAEILRHMSRNSDYISSFARVGMDGTVRSLMKDVPGRENFVLKSGSMTGVVCYCGYRLDPQTKLPTHVIAIMVNNAPDPTDVRKAISALLSTVR